MSQNGDSRDLHHGTVASTRHGDTNDGVAAGLREAGILHESGDGLVNLARALLEEFGLSIAEALTVNSNEPHHQNARTHRRTLAGRTHVRFAGHSTL
jgi:hypothetical protein